MKIREGERSRDLNREWIYGHKNILTAYMSMNQFVEAIGKMNVADGVPITLKYMNNDRIEEPPYINERKLIQDEFDIRINDIVKEPIEIIDRIKTILKGNTVKKVDLKLVVDMLSRLAADMSTNMKYMSKAANEMLDKGVTEAKMEVETSMSLAIRNAGIDMIDGSIDKLIDYMNVDKMEEIE